FGCFELREYSVKWLRPFPRKKIVCLPQQLLFVHPGKTKRAAPYQYRNLLQSRTCAQHEVFKAGIYSVSITFRRNGCRQFGFQVLKAVKAQINVLSGYGGFRFTPIDTGKVDVSPCLTGFV